MAATLRVSDVIEGSKYSETLEMVRHVRRMCISDIAVAATGYDPLVLIKALAAPGVPQFNDPHPNISNCRVRGRDVVGIANDQAFIDVTYETPQHGGTGQTGWLCRDVTTMSQATTQRTARVGNNRGIVLETRYTPVNGTEKIDKPSAQIFIPFRTLIAERITTAPLDEKYHDAGGVINSDTWRDKERGRWLFAGGETQQFGNGTYRQVLQFWLHDEWWYTLLYYRNDLQQLKNIDNPSAFTAPPAVGAQLFKNGLTLASTYREQAFGNFFPVELAAPLGGFPITQGAPSQ